MIARMLMLVLGMASLAACAGGDGRSARTARCRVPGDSAAVAATLGYLRGLMPTPQRFLVAAGTDSGVPEPVRLALQGKGPTYYYTGTEAQRKAVRDKLASVGGYTTLLVVYRGIRVVDDTSAVARFGGWYVGGQHDGKAATPRAVHLSCTPTGWQVARVEEERST
jgi:hypothetical protein